MATPGLLLLMNSAAFAFYALHSPEFLYESERLLAEVALILILFSDASYVRFARLRQN